MFTITLTAQDRCDRCSARALVVTDHDSGELLWCGHHANEFTSAMRDKIVLDVRVPVGQS